MRDREDLPYYAGIPFEISGSGWLAIVLSVVIAFLALVFLPFPEAPLNFIPALIFTGLPIGTLMAVSGWHPPAIFRKVGLGTLAAGIGFGVLTIFVSFAAGLVVSSLGATASNPAVVALEAYSTLDLALFLVRTFIQLIGEEAVSILPLLAVLWFCVQKLGLSRRMGILSGLVVSTLWFSAMHLPTYDWNFLQCVGIIGTARVVLTLAYLVTGNMWVSSIAHITNDWSLFLFSFAFGHVPIGVEA